MRHDRKAEPNRHPSLPEPHGSRTACGLASGLTRREFSEQHRVALKTLNRYISRYSGERADKPRLLRVEVTKSVCKESGVVVILACGRRVELAKDFDGTTLAEAVSVLERL